MKQIDIRILMAITAGIIIVTSIQNLDDVFLKVIAIIFGVYLAYKARFF